MALGGYDGSIKIDTKIDNSGFEKGNREQTASLKSQAAKRAAIYRKEGMSQSEAMKKAWSEIERTAKRTNSKIASNSKKASTKIQNNIGTSLGVISNSLKNLAGAVGVAFGISALVKFGKEALNIASDLQEVENVVEVSFGNMKQKVEDFADTALEKFGMTELQAKKTASTYMAMNKGMGLDGEKAAQMAIDAAGRTGDIASFYNMKQEEADTMMKSIWTGETESLKRIGVVMTETNLNMFAMQKGLGKTTQQMTQQEQVMLRYQYVMEQTRLAAGDFERTSDSWANQTRVLTGRWQQFLGIMGTGLIQMLTPAVKFLNSLMDYLIKFANVFSEVTAKIFGKQELSQGAGSASGAISDAASSTNDYAEAADKAKKANEGFLTGLDNITKMSDSSVSSSAPSSPSQNIGADMSTQGKEEEQTVSRLDKMLGNFKSFAAQLKPEVEKAFGDISTSMQNFKGTLSKIWQDVKSLGNPLKSWFDTDFTNFLKTGISVAGTVISGGIDSMSMVLSGLWDTLIFPSLNQIATQILPFFTQVKTEGLLVLESVFVEVKDIFDRIWLEGVEPALSQVQKIWSDTWDIIVEKWDTYGKPIFDKLKEAIRKTADILKDAWDNFIKPVWDNFMDTVDWLWEEHLKPFVDRFTEMIAKIVDGALEIYNKFIAPIVDWLLNFLYPPIKEAVNFVVDMIGSIIAWIADMASGIIRSLTGIIDFIVGIFTGDWKKAWEGIKDIFGGIWDMIVADFKWVINTVIDVINFFLAQGVRAINKMIGALNRLEFNVPDWVPVLGGKDLGFQIKTLPNYQIPKLATGAVIPPNAEFAAILGDQKKGRNLEAPEALIRQIVKEESGNGDFTVIVQMPDGEEKEVFSTKKINKKNRISGKIIVPVGV